MDSLTGLLISLTLIVSACVFIGYIEEKDMKEINGAYMALDMSDPHAVIEYLHLVATKPTWRIGVIVASFLSFILTALYIYARDKDNIPGPVFYFCCMTMSWIVMVGYMSYYGFHVVAPNGGQEMANKLRDPSKPCREKFSAKDRIIGPRQRFPGANKLPKADPSEIEA